MKDSTVRINDVLNFINNNNTIPLADRQHAAQLATNFIANRYPAANAGQPQYEAFSRAMHLGWHIGNDPNQNRQMRRAAYMLAKAMEDTQPGAQVPCNPQQIPDGSALTAYRDMVRKARIVSDIGAGRTAGSMAAANELYNNPLQFLTTNKIFIAGSPNRDLAQGDQNVLNFYFTYELNQDRYRFAAGAAPAGAHAIPLDSVAAMLWTNVPNSWNALNPATGNFSQIPGIELASQFMVTTQFTGCAFCMKRHGGHVYCAHLAPTRGPGANAARLLTGTALAREVAGLSAPAVVAGDFANAAGGNPLAIYGAGFGHNTVPAGYPSGLGGGQSYMSIVGVQRGPDYHIYAQVTQNATITATLRIF